MLLTGMGPPGGTVSVRTVDEPSESMRELEQGSGVDELSAFRPNHMITGSKLTGDSVIKNLYSKSPSTAVDGKILTHAPAPVKNAPTHVSIREKVTEYELIDTAYCPSPGVLHLWCIRLDHARHPHRHEGRI